MSRFLVLVALFALFSLLAFPTLAMVPTQSIQSEQTEENTNVRNVASLTTTDLLRTQDFAPQITEAPAKRSRFVNSGKGAKNSSNQMLSEMGEEKGKKGFKSSSDGTGTAVAAIADVMRPTEFSTASTLETEVNPSSPNSPIVAGTGNLSLDEMIKRSAQRNGVDQRLIMAVMRQESSFNPRATSYKGARGLMQLMPATASRFGVTDIYDPAQNIEGGTRYLRFLLNTFNGDIELALAGYNAGEHAVFRYGNRIPPYRETQDYVRKISAHYERLTNGEPVRRPTLPAETRVTKKGEVGFITVGQTMTQY